MAAPLIASQKPNWVQNLFGVDEHHSYFAVAYANDSAWIRDADPDGNILGFVPPDFHSKGKVYQQLAPDGVISP